MFLYYGDSCKDAVFGQKDILVDGSSLIHVAASRYGQIPFVTAALEEGV
jgi:hypothetical protein